jgi:hypothetical protein
MDETDYVNALEKYRLETEIRYMEDQLKGQEMATVKDGGSCSIGASIKSSGDYVGSGLGGSGHYFPAPQQPINPHVIPYVSPSAFPTVTPAEPTNPLLRNNDWMHQDTIVTPSSDVKELSRLVGMLLDGIEKMVEQLEKVNGRLDKIEKTTFETISAVEEVGIAVDSVISELSEKSA